MRRVLNLLIIILLAGAMASCTKNEDAVPVNQDIVTYDTTLVTGELEVQVFYLVNGNLTNAPQNTYVKLYATYEDLQNNFDIYDLYTNGNRAYFGFINYGTYYVTAEVRIGAVNYYAQNAVQVRPNRLETLSITMTP